MKRDMGAIREMLAWIESQPSRTEPLHAFNYPDRLTPEEGLEHLNLAIERGLVAGRIHDYHAPILEIRGLTWEGHDFLDAVRDDGVWRKVVERAKSAGLELTIELAKELAERFVRDGLGL